ncbi:hypothetical protein HPB49_026161 [Dermacentor silvarum]|nr:hypothetical protein HPB49_026161 [Dermacentor silvarum]
MILFQHTADSSCCHGVACADVKDAFGLVLRLPTEPRENLYTFVAEQSAPWRDFLCTLCQHMGKVYNVPDHSAFMKKMSVQELGLDPSSLQTTLAKALKYAAKKGEKLSRALSITRRAATPRHRLSRAVSTFISPLKSVTNQSSPLHGMRLASSSNLNVSSLVLPQPSESTNDVFLMPRSMR